MQGQPGVFIVLEGADGSGKSTQFKELKQRLISAGYAVEVFDFPRYDQPSSYFVRNYLEGKYGPAESVSPYTASLFYALDRYEAAPKIRSALKAGKVVLSDRYVGANMAHQGSKFNEAIEKRSFFIWEDSVEFQLLNIPRPSLSLFLRVPAEVSARLIEKRAERTGIKPDEHEKNLDHLRKTVETYDLLCQLFPRDFQAIDCVQNQQLLPVSQISQRIWDIVAPLLPKLPQTSDVKAESSVASSVEPQPNSRNVGRQVSEYNWEIPQISFLAGLELKAKIHSLKISANTWAGNDSDYGFYVPESLSAELTDKYKAELTSVGKLHSALHSNLTKHLNAKGRAGGLGKTGAASQATEVLRPATPLAAYSSAYATITKDQAGDILRQVSQVQNEEVQRLSRKLSEELGRLWPSIKSEFNDIASEQLMPEAIGSIIEKLTHELVPKKSNTPSESLKLIEARPRNEFDLIADGLSGFSSLPRQDVLDQISQWNYQQKVDALYASLQKSPTTLDYASYRIDCFNDWQTFSQALGLGLSNALQRQLVSPSDGYLVPQIIDEAVFEDDYREIFSLAETVYQALQAEHDGRILEYAVLLGHRLHWQMILSATDVLRSQQDQALNESTDLKKLVETAHPNLANFMDSLMLGETQSAEATSKSRRPRHRSRKK